MPHSLIRPGLHVHGDCNASPEGKVERADGAYLQRMRRRRKRPSSKSEAKAAAKQVKMKEEKRAPSAFAHCSKAVLRAAADASFAHAAYIMSASDAHKGRQHCSASLRGAGLCQRCTPESAGACGESEVHVHVCFDGDALTRSRGASA